MARVHGAEMKRRSSHELSGLDEKGSTATGYAWFIWEKEAVGAPRLMWIPPCRKALERPGDYDGIITLAPALRSASPVAIDAPAPRCQCTRTGR